MIADDIVIDRKIRCPQCGVRVKSYFEHVDLTCHAGEEAPQDGTEILGLYWDNQRFLIRWSEERSHPGGGGSMGAGWVDCHEWYPADPPDAWADASAAQG